MIQQKGNYNRECNLINRTTAEFTAEILNDGRNERIRVLNYLAEDIKVFVNYLDTLANTCQAGKIIIYASKSDWQEFLSCGFRLEGMMKTYFQGEPAYCMSRFLSPQRSYSKYMVDEDLILNQVWQKGVKKFPDLGNSGNNSDCMIRNLRDEDIDTVMDIFGNVFPTYPSPVEKRSYFENLTGQDGNMMLIAEHKDEIAGIISADIDNKYLCAELTDCITLPEYRGRGIMGILIDSLEEALAEKNLICLYSLTRAGIPPINAVLYNRGYSFGGRLINNCDIGGRYEDMNIWEKNLGQIDQR